MAERKQECDVGAFPVRTRPRRQKKRLSAVFGREMISLSRRRRNYFIRAVVLAILLAGIWTTWREVSNASRLVIRDGFVDLAFIGRSLFDSFLEAQLVMVVLIIPAITAPVVAGERERDTLGLLLLTNLNPRNILLDKLLSRITFMSLLILSGLPIFLALLAFGGIGPVQIALAYILIFSAVFFCCGVGLLVSTRSTTVRGALIGAYFATISGIVVGALLLQILFGFSFSNSLSDGYAAGLMEGSVAGLIAIYGVVCLPISLLVFFRAVRRCARILPEVAEVRGKSWWKRESDRLRGKLAGCRSLLRILRLEKVPVNVNPLLWWEFHARASASRLFLLFWSYTLTLLLYGFYIAWGWDPNYAEVISSLHIGSVLLFTVIMSATAFAGERERHALDLLLCTPQRGAAFVLAKFLGTMRSVLVFAAVPLLLPLLGLIPAFRGFEWHWLRGLGLLALAICAFLPLVIVIGLWFSAACSRSDKAVAGTFVVVCCWFLGPFLVSFLSKAAGAPRWVPDVVFNLSPTGWISGIFQKVPSGDAVCNAVFPATVVCVVAIMILVARFDRLAGRM